MIPYDEYLNAYGDHMIKSNTALVNRC